MASSLADALIDPSLMGEAHEMAPNDLFDEDIKPKVELRVEIPNNTAKDEEMEDLFGDEDEGEEEQGERTASPSASASAPREGSEALSAAELERRRELEYEEDEGQDENVVELKHAVLSIPNIPMPRSSDGKNWVLRMPNFVKLDPKPYHPDTYVGPDQADENLASNPNELREKSMSIKLEVENTIRWRWTKDELRNDKRQSNSRIIRWSDGSLSLLLGKELFDIHQAYEGNNAPPRQQSLSQSQGSQQQTSSSSAGGGLTYLVAQHKRPGILQAEAPITGHMTLRPTGMQSETHRLLARAVGQKHHKVARLRLAPDPTVAPEKEQLEAVKAAARKPRRPRGEGDGLGGHQTRKRRSYGTRRRGESVWSDEEPEAFETDEEDDDAAYGGGGGSPRKGRRGSGGDRDAKRGAGDYQTDDFLVADSSEGEGEDGGDSDAGARKKSKKRGRRRSSEADGEGEVDALEELDAKIAKQEEENRRKKRQDQAAAAHDEDVDAQPEKEGKDDPMDVDMDVESEEEEEEEFNVRRTGAGSRRKRAIAMDDEDEE